MLRTTLFWREAEKYFFNGSVPPYSSTAVVKYAMPGLDVSHLSEGGVTAHGKAAGGGGGGGRPAVPKVGRGSGILDANGVSHFCRLLIINYFASSLCYFSIYDHNFLCSARISPPKTITIFRQIFHGNEITVKQFRDLRNLVN